MATSSTPVLTIRVDVGNAVIKVKYSLTGSAYDIASGQPYREVVKLVGNDGGAIPPQTDIVGGQLADTTVVFPNATAISQTREKTILKTNLNEDNPGIDEIRAVVTLTPILPKTFRIESNEVTGNYGP